MKTKITWLDYQFWVTEQLGFDRVTVFWKLGDTYHNWDGVWQ